MLKKMIAPIIISVIIILYYIIFFTLIISIIDSWLKYLFLIIPLLVIGMVIYVCIERLKEIKKGEDNDISKY